MYKPDHQIDLMMPELKNSKFGLEFYIKVLEKLYPEDRDRVFVEMHLEEHLQRQKATKIASKQNTNEILFSIFEKIVLDYQLNEHCKFLDKFTEIFGQADTDTNGIISRHQFFELLLQMEIINDEVNYENSTAAESEADFLLRTIDPFETDSITFSEIVKLFTTYPAKTEPNASDNNIEQISILEKFVTKAIEQEENEKRIMVKLQDKILQESSQPKEEVKIESAQQITEPAAYNAENEYHEEYELIPPRTENEQKEFTEPAHNNFLSQSLDPVEEDDKEEMSQQDLEK